MDEWGVVLVIIALGGFLLSVISPIIKLNTSITKLNVTMENLTGIVKDSKNKIDEHERRITKIECHEREDK